MTTATAAPRIPALDPADATGEARDLLDAARARLGGVPNFLRVLAASPKALAGFLGLWSPLEESAALDRATRERVALAVAQANGCDYCLAAHTAIGRGAGLDAAEIAAARAGRSDADARADGAVRFAAALLADRGEVSDADVAAARRAGLDDAALVEVVALVALNVLTNTLGKAARVEVDFPRVAPLPLAA